MKNNSLFKSLFLLAAMLFANIVTNAQSTASDVVVVDLINNGDMEGNDVSSFRVKVGAGDINPAVITDGVGVNGSRGIKVEATEKIAEAWDNQFWFVLNQPVSAGTRIRVSFDYRADQGTVVSKESHAEPGNYISWGPFGGNITFSTGWNHFSYEDLLTSEESPDQNPMRSVAFTFNANFEDANNYYFDNIQFEVVMEEQCPKPTFVRNGDEVTIQSLFNATIYYTTDGSTPTTASAVYTTPLAFTQDATIKAIAVLAGYETSLVATYEFENVPVVTNSEPYAVLSDNNTVLTFYYDDQKAARNGMSIGPYTVNATYNVDEREWANHVLDITSVVFNPSFAGCETITSTEGWFSACENIQSITGLEYLNTLNVTSMYGMFYDCKSLLSLDISHFVTSKVTNMSWMFANCSSITSLDVSHFDTSKVKYIQGLFCGCGLLGSLDVSNFSTSNVIDMSWLFYNCPNLTSLDVSNFMTNNVTNMERMFQNCSSLPSLDLSNFNTDKVTNMALMFSGCTGLTSLDVSHFNTEKVTDMGNMFFNCSGLTSLDVSHFDTQNVTSMNAMFYGCSSLTSLDVSGFNTQNVTSMREMFGGCSGLTSLNVTGFNTQNVTKMFGMFASCSSLTSLDVTGFNTQNVTDMQIMFSGCSALTSLDVSHFNTQNVTSMGSMFKDCVGLTSLDVSHFNTQNVTSMNAMFYGCSSLTSLDVTGFNTQNVTDMRLMFYGCSGLTTIYVGNEWSTAAVTEGNDMFTGCASLVGGAGTHYDANHTDHTYARIDGGPNSQTPGYFTLSGAQPWVEPANPEPYAVLSENNTVLTFYYDTEKEQQNGMDVGPFSSYEARGWNDVRETITTVVFDPSFANCTTLTSTANWFFRCNHLTTITGISYLKTDNVMNMIQMFSDCSSLTSLDVSGFKTDNVVGMWWMFGGCSSLTSLDVSGFNTANVTSMGQMFDGCSSLTSLDLSGFNTANVTTMFGMFRGCSKLTTLDVSHFNTANVTDMCELFENCSSLTILDLSSFNTSQAWRMTAMFAGCSNLTTVYAGPDWSTAAVTEGNETFMGCYNLVGGAGTHYDQTHTDYTYARIDGGPNSSTPGYFTLSGAQPWVEPGEPEPYAVLGENNTVLTFYYDDQKEQRNGMSVGPFNNMTLMDIGWHSYRGKITSVVFDDSFANCTSITSTAYWFYEFDRLKEIIGIENLNTNNVTDMSYMFFMFDDNNSLTSIDLSHFDTSNVTDMTYMFFNCCNLTSLDVSGFITDNVTNMSGMFAYCSNLSSLDVSGFITDNVTKMGEMFSHCSGLTSLDVSNFKTDNVTDMRLMFRDCSSLTSLDVSNFKTDKVIRMESMFQNCSSLTSLNVTGFDTQKVTGMSDMFSGCSGLTSLDLSKFNTNKVWTMSQVFSGCSNLTTIYAGSEWSTAAVTEGNDMFTGCTSLVGGAGTHLDANHVDHTYARIDGGPNSETPGYFTRSGDQPWVEPGDPEPYAVLSENNTVVTFYYDDKKAERNGMGVGPFDDAFSVAWSSNAVVITKVVFDASFADYSPTSTAFWFINCSALTAITGMENLKTQNVTDMSFMFSECSGLTSLDMTHFNTQNVTSMYGMFADCTGLTSLDVTHFNTQNVTIMQSMFHGCSALTSLDVTGFNTQNVTNMYEMFYGCSGLTSLDVSHFKTDNVMNMAEMFLGCSSLTSIDVSHFNTQNATDMNYMFCNCKKLMSLDVSGFRTDNVTNLHSMFFGCSGLTNLDLSGFKTGNVTIMGRMFEGCSGLTTIYVGDGWSTAAVTNGSSMFYGCTNLVGGAGTHYDASHIDYTYARIDGGPNSETPGYFTDKNVDNTLAVDEDGYYLLGTVEDWRAFAAIVDNTPNVNAKMIADIDLGNDQTMIGYNTPFEGTFDGQGHSLTVNIAAEWDVAPFRYVKGVTIKNIHVFGNLEATSTCGVGGIVAYVHNVDEKVTTVSKCWSSATMTSTTTGGQQNTIAGIVCSTNGILVIEDCLFDGKFNERNQWFNAGIVANVFNDVTIRNTLNIGDYPDNSEYSSGTFYRPDSQRGNVLLENVYYKKACGTAQGVQVTGAQLTDGSVVTLLQNGRSDEIWIQGESNPILSFNPIWEATFDGVTAKVGGSATLDDAFESVGGRTEAAKTICAIIWNKYIPITDSDLAGINNPNLLVYVNDASLAPHSVRNVVVNGVAQEIVLTDAATGNNNWFCPQEFRAEKISYSREFKQQTQIGVSRGWESIALPFTVETITHEQRGQIAPFGNDASDLHFWLRHLGRNGLAGSQRIEANTPYVISMPNSDEYPERYNLSGRVTFSAENVMVPVTDPVMDETNDLAVVPTFLRMAANEDIYALNVGEERNGHPEGSIFERNYREVRPFEAYTLHQGTGPAPQYFALGDLTTTSLETVQSSKIKVQSENEWFTLDGRKLDKQPTQKGVYIHNGAKVVIK